MKAVSKILNVIALVFTWAAILFAGVLFVPRLFGVVPYIVQSGSMEPLIKTGSVVYVDSSDRDISTGRVMAYELSNGTIVVHRAVSQDPESGEWVMRGDANDLPDAIPVGLEQVRGSYLFSIPLMGYVLAFLEQNVVEIGGFMIPAASFFIIGFILLFNLAAYFLSAWQEEEAGNEKE